MNQKSIGSVLIFVGSTLCFFLPFVTVSCGGIKAVTLTGQQLATGTTLTQPQMFGPPQTQKLNGDPFAALAWAGALAGVALSLVGRKMAAATAITGGAGALSLLILKVRLDDQLQKQGGGMVTASYETGFVLAFLLLVAGVAWNAYSFVQSRRSQKVGVPAGNGGAGHGEMLFGSPPQPRETPGVSGDPVRSGMQVPTMASTAQNGNRFCAQCGQQLKLAAKFCEACGSPASTSSTSANSRIPVQGGTA